MPQTMVHSKEPPLRCRFSGELNLAFLSLQRHSKCKNYEYRYADCISGYGYYRGQEKCKCLKEDLDECIFMTKQALRVTTMLEERKRQLKEGKRDFIASPRSDLL